MWRAACLCRSFVRLFSTTMVLINDSYFCILVLYCYVLVVESADVDVTSVSDSLLCRRCGHKVTSSDHIKNIGSKLALRQRNDTILGDKACLIQLFKNPDGYHFELITATSASIKSHGKENLEHSWFPEFAWRIATCPQCGAHLGWSFEDPKHSHNHKTTKKHVESNRTKKQYSFVGLIYPNLIQQNYADSLIITPKAYRG